MQIHKYLCVHSEKVSKFSIYKVFFEMPSIITNHVCWVLHAHESLRTNQQSEPRCHMTRSNGRITWGEQGITSKTENKTMTNYNERQNKRQGITWNMKYKVLSWNSRWHRLIGPSLNLFAITSFSIGHCWLVPAVSVANELAAQPSNTWSAFAVAVASRFQKPSTLFCDTKVSYFVWMYETSNSLAGK